MSCRSCADYIVRKAIKDAVAMVKQEPKPAPVVEKVRPACNPMLLRAWK